MISGTIISKLTKFYAKLEGDKTQYSIVIQLNSSDKDKVDYHLLKDFTYSRELDFLKDIYDLKIDPILNRDIIVNMFLVKKIKFFAELYEINPVNLYMMIVPNEEANDFAVYLYKNDNQYIIDENMLLVGTPILDDSQSHVKIYAEQLVDM